MSKRVRSAQALPAAHSLLRRQSSGWPCRRGFAAAPLLAALAFPPAALAVAISEAIVLEGDYLRIGVGVDGTLGVGGNTSPGILFDVTGSRTFNPAQDYLTPGSPYEAWAVQFGADAGRTAEVVVINSSMPLATNVGTLQDFGGIEFDGTTFDNRAVYTHSYDDFDLLHDYFFNDDSLQINIRTSITAKTDLTDLFFTRAMDPDVVAAVGDATTTRNVLIETDTATLIYSEALVSKTVIGLLSFDPSASTGLGFFGGSNLATTHSGAVAGELSVADQTIGMSLGGVLLANGEVVSFDYQYVFGADVAAALASAGGGSSTPEPQPIVDSADAADVLDGTALAVFDGGRLTMADQTIAETFTVEAAGGVIDTTEAGSVATIVGFTGDGGMEKTGAGELVLSGDSDHTGGTQISAGTLRVQGSLGGAVDVGADGRYVVAQDDVIDALALAGQLDLESSLTVSALSGSGSASIGAGRSFRVDQASDSTFAGDISGAGGFIKQGDGQLVLSGDSDHTGGTQISAGTLRVQGSLGGAVDVGADGRYVVAQDDVIDALALAGQLDLESNLTVGTLLGDGIATIGAGHSFRVDQAANSTFSGAIAGAGGFAKAGSGTLMLTGSLAPTAGTMIEAGVLDTSAGGSLAGDLSIATAGRFVAGSSHTLGSVTNAGRLDVDANLATLSLANTGSLNLRSNLAISGAFLQNGVLSVSGERSLSTTTLSGSGQVDLASGATLLLQQTGHSTFAGDISGAGRFIKQGGGNLLLSGDHAIGGGTRLDAGSLQIEGVLGSALDVGAGGVLLGSGRIEGDAIIRGVISPGSSPGTMTVEGQVTMDSNGIFRAEIDGPEYSEAGGAGSYDRLLLVGSDAGFEANGTLEVLLRGISGDANNDYTPAIGDRFTIVSVEAPGSVTGAFTDLTLPGGGLAAGTRLDVRYGATDVQLLTTPADLGVFGSRLNQRESAAALQTIRPSATARRDDAAGALFEGIYDLGLAQYEPVLDQLSGEIHAFALDSVRSASRQLGRTVGDRVMASRIDENLRGSGERVWFSVQAREIEYDADRIASRYDIEQKQFIVGFDLLEHGGVKTGLALGYQQGDVNARASGSAEIDLFSVSLYTSLQHGSWSHRAVGTALSGNSDVARRVDLAGGPSRLRGEEDVFALQASLASRYDTALRERLFGFVEFGVDADSIDADGATEGGDARTLLAVESERYTSLGASLRVGLRGDFEIGASPARWQVDVGSRRDLGVGERVIERQVSLHDASWSASTTGSRRQEHFANADLQLQTTSQSSLRVHLGGMRTGDADGLFGGITFEYQH